MIEIEFSGHALKRMKQRKVTEEEISETLANPDKTGTKEDTSIAMKLRKNGHILIVIYTATKNTHKIITVIDTSKVDKYL